MSPTNNNSAIILEVKIAMHRLCSNIDVVKEKQEEMGDDIAKIKEAVYNPDEGLYARLRSLEAWKNTSSKMIWTLFTSMVGLIAAFILKSIGP